MRAVVYQAFKGPITVETVTDPVPPDDAALIAVHASGLCRSDWHGWQGHDPDIRRFPHVPGHEFAGEVVALGRGVTRWRGGERVTAPFVCGCGSCAPCSRGDHQVCDHQIQPGFTHWGSFAELVVVRHADVNLVPLPDAIDSVTAAALGCRFATAFRAVADQARVQPGEWLAVHGCGGVGLSAVMIGGALGARVIAVDVAEEALERASSFGAEATINADEQASVVEAIRDLTGGGADASLDALGSTVTASNSIACLRKNGRHVQVGLLVGADHRPPLPMELVIARELSVIGSHGMAAHQYPRMLAMIADGRLRPELLVGRTVPLEALPAELESMPTQRSGGMVVMTED